MYGCYKKKRFTKSQKWFSRDSCKRRRGEARLCVCGDVEIENKWRFTAGSERFPDKIDNKIIIESHQKGHYALPPRGTSDGQAEIFAKLIC
jgi:hypothetical protein